MSLSESKALKAMTRPVRMLWRIKKLAFKTVKRYSRSTVKRKSVPDGRWPKNLLRKCHSSCRLGQQFLIQPFSRYRGVPKLKKRITWPLHDQFWPNFDLSLIFIVITSKFEVSGFRSFRDMEGHSIPKLNHVTPTRPLLKTSRCVDQFWQTRYSDENSVCLSVRLFVKGVLCDKMEERSVQILISYKISFSLVFWEEEWLVGATPCTWNFGSTGPVEANSPILNR